jgi:hypothetical protein
MYNDMSRFELVKWRGGCGRLAEHGSVNKYVMRQLALVAMRLRQRGAEISYQEGIKL